MGSGLLLEARLAPSLSSLVKAFCLDYPRICGGASPGAEGGVDLSFYRISLFEGAAELVGEELAEDMIREIGNGVGYAKSQLYDFSEVTYKQYKMLARHNIARRLGLLK